MPETIATIENMKRYHQQSRTIPGDDGDITILPQQPVAYSPSTGEQYSANPGDYWNAPDGWTMTDADGEPMILVFERHTFEDVADA